ncbi:MAG: hypothetical protein U0556_08170 [Dehalococcoidia bacterium]
MKGEPPLRNPGAGHFWRLAACAALATGALCLLLVWLPSFSQASGQVTNCANQTDLQSKLSGGGLVTFSCGVATIPVGSTLVITSPTTIDGGGQITLDGQDVTRILSVTGSVALTLTNLTLDRGRAITGNGGALLSLGEVVLDRVTVMRSSAASGSGGGVFASSATVTGSSFVSNTALFGGGLRHLHHHSDGQQLCQQHRPDRWRAVCLLHRDGDEQQLCQQHRPVRWWRDE